MKITKAACAGTMESSDAYVEIEPHEGGLSIQTESVVSLQFGEAIDRAIREVLAENGVTDAAVHVVDRGALDCVLRARVETAIKRSGEDA